MHNSLLTSTDGLLTKVQATGEHRQSDQMKNGLNSYTFPLSVTPHSPGYTYTSFSIKALTQCNMIWGDRAHIAMVMWKMVNNLEWIINSDNTF